jgi:hypothetical protein
MYLFLPLLIEIPSKVNPVYLDPGTGSMLLQVILAATMSVSFVIGLLLKKPAAGGVLWAPTGQKGDQCSQPGRTRIR